MDVRVRFKCPPTSMYNQRTLPFTMEVHLHFVWTQNPLLFSLPRPLQTALHRRLKRTHTSMCNGSCVRFKWPWNSVSNDRRVANIFGCPGPFILDNDGKNLAVDVHLIWTQTAKLIDLLGTTSLAVDALFDLAVCVKIGFSFAVHGSNALPVCVLPMEE